MKKLKILAVILCIFSVLALCGCGNKELDSASIVRDDLRTGGSLSFVYDQKECIIYIGGQDEVVQYSQADETRDLDAGCRVGLKVTAPNENLDLSTATLEMNGVNYSSGSFLEKINGQRQRFFNLYPIVSPKDDRVSFSVTWQDGTEKQTYKIIIVPGTKFEDKNGNIS